MPRRSTHTDDSALIEALRMAYCQAVLEMDNANIAVKFYTSAPTVSRRLELARQKGWLETKTILNLTKIPEDLREQMYVQVSNDILARKIQEPLGTDKLPRLTVVPSEEGKDEVNRQRVGRAAAYRLFQWLPQEMPSQIPENETIYVGISWGRTVRAMVEAFPTFFSPPLPTHCSVEFVPLCGHFPLEKGGDLIHSSAVLAAELGRVVSGGERPPEYALSFPAFLPQGLSDSEKAMVQKFLEMYPTYTTIMGRPSSTFAASEPSEEEPLVDRLHGLLTSVGEWPAEGFSKYISAQEKEELEKAKVVGDLLGNFVTANQVDGFPEDNPISRINDRFLGAKPRHIRRCALRARKGGALGVVIIAHGCAKAATLLSVINADCVTEAIIDEELAEEIVRLREEKLATD